jgi:hypothetical protein
VKRKAILIFACIAFVLVAAVSIWKDSWIVTLQDGASDPQKGVALLTKTWKSLGEGTIIDETHVTYSSSEEARQHFERKLNESGTVIERTNSTDGASDVNGRAIIVFGNPDTRAGAATIIKLQGKEIQLINASSLKYALAFERAWVKFG